jgi:hypothetical protein
MPVVVRRGKRREHLAQEVQAGVHFLVRQLSFPSVRR